MFNIGFSELIILGIIALVFLGPQQLPEVARTLGRLLNEWKRATGDFQSQFTQNLHTDYHQKRSDLHTEENTPPTDHDVAVLVKKETPDSATLPEGAAPVAGHHGENKE